MANTIKIKGIKSFHKALELAPEKMGEEIQDALAISLAEIHREAVPRTPVDTGALRRGYRERVVKMRGTLSNIMIYAGYQHEGYFRHPRGGQRQYLFNALKAKKNDIKKNFERAIELVFEHIARNTKS